MPPSLLLLACLSGLAPTLAETSQDPDPAALLRSKDPVERLRAVELLRGGENPKAERLLKGALDDADWEVIERPGTRDKHEHERLGTRLLTFLEDKILHTRIGEYKNYTLIKY